MKAMGLAVVQELSWPNISFTLTDRVSQFAMSSIKRDVKKKSPPRPETEILSRSSPLYFHFSGEVWLVVHSREFLC